MGGRGVKGIEKKKTLQDFETALTPHFQILCLTRVMFMVMSTVMVRSTSWSWSWSLLSKSKVFDGREK